MTHSMAKSKVPQQVLPSDENKATANRKIGSRASAKFFGMWEGFVRFQRHIFGCRAWHLCGAAGGWRKACGSAAPGKWEGEIRFFDFPTESKN